MRWRRRCRGAVTPIPGSRGSEGDGDAEAESRPLHRSPNGIRSMALMLGGSRFIACFGWKNIYRLVWIN